MRTYRVEIEVTRTLTFLVEDAEDAAEAIRQADRSLWDGEDPEEEGMPSTQVQSVTVDDREIRFHYHLDYAGPKDDRGLTQWNVNAHEGYSTAVLTSGQRLSDVAVRAEDLLGAATA